MIEVAEKTILWLRFDTHGKQCHASTPQLGANTLLASSWLAVRLNELHGDFPLSNPLFDIPHST
ncbi:MAG: peptidase dimerization domain-containing protein, partial [Spirochaetales bacterium]|nr:peptidase dimerization domain-containing protein [Spirochaetales bacterium]